VSLEEAANAALLKLKQEDEDLQNLHSMLLTSLRKDNTSLSKHAVTASEDMTFGSRISRGTLVASGHTFPLAEGADLGLNQSQPSLEMDNTYLSKKVHSEFDPESKSAGNHNPSFSRRNVDMEAGSAADAVGKGEGETAVFVKTNPESFGEEINQLINQLEQILEEEHFGEECFSKVVFGQASISEGPSVSERRG